MSTAATTAAAATGDDSQRIREAIAGLSTRGQKLPKFTNHAQFFASDAMKSESARVDANFMNDFASVLAGGSIYLKNFLSEDSRNFTLMKGILSDLEKWQTSQKQQQQLENQHQDAVKENREQQQQQQQQKRTQSKAKAMEVQQTHALAPTPGEQELESLKAGFVAWSKHEKFENPDISPTFNAIVQYLIRYFDLDPAVSGTRLNLYRDGQAWKTFHHDRNAYVEDGNTSRGDLTVGVSLGASRDLAFKHVPGGPGAAAAGEDDGGKAGDARMFRIPQGNGDCFAFDNSVNKAFLHGVPKKTSGYCGARLSIIVWGTRKSLNERNGGGVSVPKNLFSNTTNQQFALMKNNDGSLNEGGQQLIVAAAKQLLAADVSAARGDQPRMMQQRKPSNQDDDAQQHMQREASGASSAAPKPKKKKNRLQ